MTTWTSISNAAVAVGGIPSSTTVTALRDNPSALAESASGAPVMVSGWHPHDKVSIGDGKTGLIYDFAISGPVSSVITADFVDGYEYRIIAADLSHNNGSNASFLLELYKETSAVYVDAINTSTLSNTDAVAIDSEILTPRLTLKSHAVRSVYSVNGNVGTAFTSVIAYNSTSQKVSKARIRFGAGSIDAGKVWMFRRREYASLP
jgi:hypothetical protein